MSRTNATFVSVDLLDPSGVLRPAARLGRLYTESGREGVHAGAVGEGRLDRVYTRRTVSVRSAGGGSTPVMSSPITTGKRLEGSIRVTRAGRQRWTCDDVAALVDARRTVEELVRSDALASGASTAGRSDRAEILGILGGMGPAASAAFLTTLVAATPAGHDQEHLRVLLDSNPQIPDRTAFLLGAGPDPRLALLDSARRLRAAGATCLVMPCNTANVFVPYLAQRVPLSIVPWISTAVAAVPGSGPVGILATDGTILSQVYQRALARVGRAAVEPVPGERAVIMRSIYGPEGVKRGTLSPHARESLLAVASALVERGAERLLLGCTELPLLLPEDADEWPVPATDPGLAVARRIVNTLTTDRRPS